MNKKRKIQKEAQKDLDERIEKGKIALFGDDPKWKLLLNQDTKEWKYFSPCVPPNMK